MGKHVHKRRNETKQKPKQIKKRSEKKKFLAIKSKKNEKKVFVTLQFIVGT